MPAVNPTRLNFQIADLMQSFHEPDAFHKKLRDLFSLYANRTLRDGDMTARRPFLPAYHLPEPVMRQLRSELKSAASAAPEEALNLADALWGNAYLEIRQVSIFLLGHAGVPDPEPVLSRLNDWLSSDPEPVLRESLLNTGTHHLQTRLPAQWENWIEALLSRKEPTWNAIGLAGLRASIGSDTPQRLPAVFRMLSPFIQNPEPELINELKRLISVLAAQSPTETAYFLKQGLSLSSASGTARLIRQSLSLFSDEIQGDLKATLKSK